jgi:ATP-binding cassette subfamily B multidrug efflux pump
MSISKNKWYKDWKNTLWYKGAWKLALGAVVSIILTNYLGVILPEYMMRLSRDFSNQEMFLQHLKTLAVIFVAIFGLRVVYQIAVNAYVRELVQNLRTRCFNDWLRSLESYRIKSSKDQFPLGEIIARLMNDTLAIRELVNSGAFSLIIDIFFVFSCLVGLVRLNGMLGMLLSVVIVLVTWLLIWGSDYMRIVFHDVRNAKGLVSRQMANVVAGFKENFFYPKSTYASRTGLVAYNNFLDKQLVANVWDASYYSVAESLYPILLAAMAIALPNLPGVESFLILALVDLIQRAINPIKSVAGKITNIQRAATGLQRIDEFFEHLQALPKSSDTIFKVRNNFSGLTFDLKHFSYGESNQRDTFTMNDISFHAKKGELIGLAGPSGQGKSTLLKILAAILEPQEGNITLHFDEPLHYDGKDVAGHEEYRHYVGLVSQESHLFTQSMAFNITLSESSQQERKSLEMFWSELVGQLPYLQKWNLDSALSPTQLSAGERQLICSIRALYLRRPIVCFDEVASAMDSRLEEALRQAIVLVQSQSLTLIVAHRLETIMHADQILVIDKGRLVKKGKHQDLMQQSPQYQDFVAQLKQENPEHRI